MCQLYLNQVFFTLQNMLIKLIKCVNFNEAHVANHLMHLTETFAVKLSQIAVPDSKKVPARILLIELTKIIIFCRLNLNITKNANL